MDVLRSCYETTMRFPRAGLVRVRWYWTDEPFLPYPTAYYSARWDKDGPEWYDWDYGLPGEIPTKPRPYRKGQSPTLSDCTGPAGTPEQWLGGLDLSQPLHTCGVWGAPYSLDYSDEYDSLTFAEE